MADTNPTRPDPTDSDANSTTSSRRLRILMLTHRLPHPPDRGDRIASYHRLRHLAASHDVYLASLTDENIQGESEAVLSEIVQDFAVTRVSPTQRNLRAIKAIFTGKAITPTVFYDALLMRMVEGLHRNKPFDVIYTFCTGMAEYARRILAMHEPAGPGIPPRPFHILDLVDVDSEKWQGYADNAAGLKRWLYAREARKLRQIEAGSTMPVDAVGVISDAEAKLYQQRISSNVQPTVIGNGVDLEYFKPLPASAEPIITFVGVLDYPPNVEAVQWFVREVWPTVLEMQPEARCRIVGKRPTEIVRALDATKGVTVVGEVADVRDELARALVVIAPLQQARGVQNKVLEALACARPVVVTPPALEGIDVEPGTHLLCEEDAPAFARAVLKLLSDEALRQQLAGAGRQCVEQRYHWQTRLAAIDKLLAEAKLP